jgi:RNA polymerase sigma-70 factor (ECF subfamily)
MLQRLGVSDADVEDLTHDVFVTALQNLAIFDPSLSLRAWLFGIVVTRVRVHRRRRLSRRFENLFARERPVASGEQGADERIASREARALVLWALRGLTLDQRGVFVMHELEDFGMPEVAFALDIQLDAAYARLFRARERFRRSIRRLPRGDR